MADADRPRLTITWVQIASSAGAAVTAAVVASFFGIAGTFIGSAVASAVFTTFFALYQHSIHRTREHMRVLAARRADADDPTPDADQPALTPPAGGDTTSPVGPDLTPQDTAGDDLPPPFSTDVAFSHADDDAPPLVLPADDPDALPPESWHDRFAAINWPGVAVTSVVVFALAVAGIWVIERVTDAPLSSTVRGQSGSGGTSIGHLFSGSHSTRTPTPGPSGGPQPTPTGTSSPSASATVVPSDSTSPHLSPSLTPSSSLTPSVSASPTSPTPSVSASTSPPPAATDTTTASPTPTG